MRISRRLFGAAGSAFVVAIAGAAWRVYEDATTPEARIAALEDVDPASAPKRIDEGASVAEQEPSPTVRVFGRVVDPDGRPLSGAKIRARVKDRRGVDYGFGRRAVEGDIEATSDSDGRFSLPLPTNSHAAVRVVPIEHADVVIPVAHWSEVEHDLGVVVAPHGGVVEGVVVDESGAPISNVDVVVEHQEPPDSEFVGDFAPVPSGRRTVVSDDDGAFICRGVRRGACSVRVETTSRRRRGASASVVVGTPVKLTMPTEPGTTVRGRVVDAAGNPIAEAHVDVSQSTESGFGDLLLSAMLFGRGEAPTETTGSDGRFEVSGLGPPPYTVQVLATGEGTARCVGGPEDLAKIVLTPPARLWGRALDSEGRPVRDFEINVVGTNSVFSPRNCGPPKVATGAEAARLLGVEDGVGLWCVTDIVCDAADVFVRSKGVGAEIVCNASIVPGRTTETPICLGPDREIAGVVRDAEGKPVGDASVVCRLVRGVLSRDVKHDELRPFVVCGYTGGAAWSAAFPDIAARSASDGTFAISALPEGDYEVSVVVDGAGAAPSRSARLRGWETRARIDLTIDAVGSVEGRVVDDFGGAASHVLVLALSKAPDPARTRKRFVTATDREGAFLFPRLPVGTYDFYSSVHRSGPFDARKYSTDRFPFLYLEQVSVRVEADGTERVVLSEPGRCSARVKVLKGGVPVPDALASLWLGGEGLSAKSGGDLRRVADREGVCTFDDLVVSPYVLRVRAPRSPESTTVVFELAKGEDRTIIVDLPTGAFEGRVLDKKGTPVAFAKMRARFAPNEALDQRWNGDARTFEDDDDERPRETRDDGLLFAGVETDAEGFYRFECVSPGTYFVSADAPDCVNSGRMRVVVREEDPPTRFDFRLTRFR